MPDDWIEVEAPEELKIKSESFKELMEFDAKALKEQLNCYFKGEISQGDLGEWANKAYYDILKGGYIETKKIVIYPFLKTISTFHVEENDKEDVFPCSEEDVKKVGDILKSIRPALPGDVPRGYALSSITSLTCTLFDPSHIG